MLIYSSWLKLFIRFAHEGMHAYTYVYAFVRTHSQLEYMFQLTMCRVVPEKRTNFIVQEEHGFALQCTKGSGACSKAAGGCGNASATCTCKGEGACSKAASSCGEASAACTCKGGGACSCWSTTKEECKSQQLDFCCECSSGSSGNNDVQPLRQHGRNIKLASSLEEKTGVQVHAVPCHYAQNVPSRTESA